MNSSFSDTPASTTGEYPRLMINKDKDAVVLFTEKSTGMVVSCLPGYDQVLGHFATDWYMGRFEPFQGEVTLRG